MHVDALEIQIAAARQSGEQLVESSCADAELVFFCACSDVFVGMRVDVRIDPDGDGCLETHAAGYGVDYFNLLDALAVEYLDTGLKGGDNLFVSLGDSVEEYSGCREAVRKCEGDFVACCTLSLDTGSADGSQDAVVGIGLYCIVSSDAVLAEGGSEIVNGVSEDVHVIVEERGLHSLE